MRLPRCRKSRVGAWLSTRAYGSRQPLAAAGSHTLLRYFQPLPLNLVAPASVTHIHLLRHMCSPKPYALTTNEEIFLSSNWKSKTMAQKEKVTGQIKWNFSYSFLKRWLTFFQDSFFNLVTSQLCIFSDKIGHHLFLSMLKVLYERLKR